MTTSEAFKASAQFAMFSFVDVLEQRTPEEAGVSTGP